jgi:hypothetical protein
MEAEQDPRDLTRHHLMPNLAGPGEITCARWRIVFETTQLIKRHDYLRTNECSRSRKATYYSRICTSIVLHYYPPRQTKPLVLITPRLHRRYQESLANGCSQK